MKIYEVTGALEEYAPLELQESYDNSGLQVGDPSHEVSAVLCTVDVSSDIIDEAVKLKANLIISHHPVIFGNLKSITGRTAEEKIIIRALKHDIAIYSAHTNFDKIAEGVNQKICEKLGLTDTAVLSPSDGLLAKLVTFVPKDHADKVRNAMFEAGAGHIGRYDSCSFNLAGTGTFRGGEGTDPFVGETGKLHTEDEIRIETIVPKSILPRVLREMMAAHPYEEVAYDIYPLENSFTKAGSGMTGTLPEPVSHTALLKHLKKVFGIPVLRYAGKRKDKYQRIAVCGGSGSFLIKSAIHAGADAFLTGDLKYHQFFHAGDQLLVCDIGHYESEQFTKEIFYSLLTKKFSTFAVHLSGIVTNPIKYFI